MKTLSAAVLILVAIGSHSRAEDAPKGDLGKLQGKWSALVGPQKDVPLVLTIKGNDVTVLVSLPDGNDIELKGQIKVDDKAEPNKTLDWVNFSSPQGDSVEDNLAIYKIEGEEVTICSGGPGNQRPDTFQAAADGGQYPSIIKLKRVTE